MDTQLGGGQVICLRSQLVVETRFLSQYNSVPNSSCLLSHLLSIMLFFLKSTPSLTSESMEKTSWSCLLGVCVLSAATAFILLPPTHSSLTIPTTSAPPSCCLCQRARCFSPKFLLFLLLCLWTWNSTWNSFSSFFFFFNSLHYFLTSNSSFKVKFKSKLLESDFSVKNKQNKVSLPCKKLILWDMESKACKITLDGM